MSQKHSLNSVALAAVFALAIFVVAFALFMFVGDYRVLASMFMAFVVALLAGIVLFIGFGTPTGQAAPAQARTAPVTPAAPAPAAPATPEPEPEEDEAALAERREAEEAAQAIAARRQAEEESAAARKRAEEEEAAEAARAKADEAAKRSAEEQAARDKAEAEAKAAADAEAARKAADARQAAEAESTPDYDGDGVREGRDEGTRPAGLDAPRDGTADDLKQIKGIGPKMEKLCNSLGFWHFDQIASWSEDEVAWVDANLEGFKGRVTRDEWVQQAEVLAGGGETEFSKRVEDGDVY